MYRPIFTKILILLAFGLFLWLSLKFLLPIGFPFLLALLLALAADKGVGFLQEKLHFPRPLATGIGVSCVFALFAAMLVLLLAGLMRQLPRVADLAPRLEQAITSGQSLVTDWLFNLADRLPGSIGAVLRQWTEGLFSGGTELLDGLMQSLPGMVTGFAGKLSNGMFGILTGLIAAFMISIRLPKLRVWLRHKLPSEGLVRCKAVLTGVKRAFGGWALAQLKLMAVTFAILAAGFLLLGIRRSLLWASLIALVDAFPILGVGTVLLPWSFLLLLQGEYARGLGLLAVYAVAWLARSILEPKWVGKGIGLDPLLTLGSIYAGFRLGGILGMLLCPWLAMAAAEAWKAWQKPTISP